MNVPFFIARRIRHTPTESFSATVTKVGVASIAIGLASVIVAFAVLFGYKYAIQQKIFVFGSHITVSKFSLNNSYEETPLALKTPLYQQAGTIPGVRHIQGVATKAGMLKTADELSGAILKGVGREYDWELFRSSLVAGTLPRFYKDSAQCNPNYSCQVLISKRISERLQLDVGKDVIMYFIGNQLRPRKLQVTGIYDTGLEEGDNVMVIGDLRLIQQLNNWGADSVGSYEVFVNDFNDLDNIYRQVREAASPDMRPMRVTDIYKPLFDWMTLLDQNTGIFLGLILFVAGFNMVAILLVLMLERTPMIGLLKAFGSSNTLIRRVFLYVGLNMVLKGLFIGNLLGIGLCALQYYFKLIPLDPKNYYMDTVPIAWNFTIIALVNVATIVLIALALWLPTLVATRIQPVKALVFKK
ncbi:ABC transporter permease [Larkinella arboricola]|uniref:Lipoprotein-releasing system permease protein n=1 Tax=Larkinella arboricola TaxID=643671 RepID=A0A327WU69_LARAB|nr:FtsX-like permease family protein [Larkinella arboricola]RAJ92290.1 lipoprotein-releasing system permease protein [Larkinella arboricola]